MRSRATMATLCAGTRYIFHTWTANFVLPVFGFCILAGFSLLFAVSGRFYHSVIDLWSFIPFRYPFIDAEYVSAQIDCWKKGIDVYVANPCDALARVQNLSPLWLRLPFWPADKSWTNLIGLSTDAVFITSLVALPKSRSITDTILLCITLISPAVMFGLERANQDLVMFALIMVAITFLERSLPARLVGYTLIVMAALLKFYPIILLIVALRESSRTAILLLVAVGAIVGSFVWGFHVELRAALGNIPMPPTFIPGFGAGRLPDGLCVLLAKFGAAPPPGVLRLVSFFVLSAFVCAAALRLAATSAFSTAFDCLSVREKLCLVSGAALICGCFFAGTSTLYRGIYFLLVLPGLFALARLCPLPAVRRLVRSTGWLALVLLYSLPADRLVDRLFGAIRLPEAPTVTMVYWFCCELAWWWTIAILLAALIHFTRWYSPGSVRAHAIGAWAR